MMDARVVTGLLFGAILGGGALTASSQSDTTPTCREPTGSEAYEDLNPGYDAGYQFARIRYTPTSRGGFYGFRRRGGREPMWHHDYPRADGHFLKILDEVTLMHPRSDGCNVFTADDPGLGRYPIAYIVEVGSWNPTDAEVQGLRSYLLKGGFLMVDDFRGERALGNFGYQMGRVLPGSSLIELHPSHEIFDSFFRIDPYEVLPPPIYGSGLQIKYYAIFEDNDPSKRIMVVVNYDNDIGEYWEWSDTGFFPIDLTNDGYKLGVNYIVYAMTH